MLSFFFFLAFSYFMFSLIFSFFCLFVFFLDKNKLVRYGPIHGFTSFPPFLSLHLWFRHNVFVLIAILFIGWTLLSLSRFCHVCDFWMLSWAPSKIHLFVSLILLKVSEIAFLLFDSSSFRITFSLLNQVSIYINM